MSPWRRRLYRELEKHELTGRVLDVGGDSRSGYHALLRGEKKVEVVNLSRETGAEHIFDLEEKFPLPDASYDGVICMNIMEHIYNHEQFLSECRRILKPGGKILLAVPFIMQVHPSPHDYFRYTDETLKKIFADAEFHNVQVTPIGKGPFTAASHVAHNVLSKVPLLAQAHGLVSSVLDDVLVGLDKKQTFSTNRYPLGYLVAAVKSTSS